MMKTSEKLNMTMLCDFYELTMGNGYFKNGYKDRTVIFDVFFRRVPDQGGFAIAAGLEQLIEVERIDLALCFGEPTFMRTLEIVAGDMKVEKIVLAEEIKEQNPAVLGQIQEFFAGQDVEVEFVSHTELKARTNDCKAVIRTGETTPYANIILQSGCIFA